LVVVVVVVVIVDVAVVVVFVVLISLLLFGISLVRVLLFFTPVNRRLGVKRFCLSLSA